MERLIRACSDRARGSGFKLRGWIQIKYKEVLCCEFGEALAQVAQRNNLSHPGSVQGQVSWAFEQPGLAKRVPAYGRGVKLDNL